MGPYVAPTTTKANVAPAATASEWPLDSVRRRSAYRKPTGRSGSSLCGNWFFAAMRAIADQVNLVRPRQLAPIDSRVRNKALQGFSFRPSS
jgi:hypothetical protein